jgi:hypothetical protein
VTAVDAESTRSQPQRSFFGWRLVLAVIAVAIVTHLPGLVRTEVLNPDEAFLATQARVVNDGGALYQDAVDRKPPIVPYLYALTARVTGSDDVVWPRVLAVVAHIVTALLLAAVARRRWGESASWAAALLYLVASAALVLEDSQAANFETFMLPLMCGAVLLAERGRDVSAGAAAAAATLTKQVAATTLLPLGYLAWRRAGAAGVARLAVAFAVPIVAVAALFGWSDFWFWVFTGTGGYLDPSGSWRVALGRGFGSSALFVAANLGATILVVTAWRRRSAELDLWLWLAAAALGVASGLRFFGHYYLQLAPPFALLAAGSFATAPRAARVRTAVLGAVCVVVFVALAFSWHPPVLRPYERVAAAIDTRTKTDDRIFVWGQFPELYWAADRPPATRFLTAGFLTGFGGGRSAARVGREFAVSGAWEDFEADLAAHPPSLIVDASVDTVFSIDRFPDFASFVADGYDRVEEVDGTVLYVRR